MFQDRVVEFLDHLARGSDKKSKMEKKSRNRRITVDKMRTSEGEKI